MCVNTNSQFTYTDINRSVILFYAMQYSSNDQLYLQAISVVITILPSASNEHYNA